MFYEKMEEHFKIKEQQKKIEKLNQEKSGMISSSDHDSDGNIKKTHIPFE